MAMTTDVIINAHSVRSENSADFTRCSECSITGSSQCSKRLGRCHRWGSPM